MTEEAAGPNGGYMTRGRALSLERQIAASEARVMQRMDRLEADLRAARATTVDALRAQASALLHVLRDEIAGEQPAGPTHLRRTGGT